MHDEVCDSDQETIVEASDESASGGTRTSCIRSICESYGLFDAAAGIWSGFNDVPEPIADNCDIDEEASIESDRKMDNVMNVGVGTLFEHYSLFDSALGTW